MRRFAREVVAAGFFADPFLERAVVLRVDVEREEVAREDALREELARVEVLRLAVLRDVAFERVAALVVRRDEAVVFFFAARTSALTSWSLRMLLQPVTPSFFANLARSLSV